MNLELNAIASELVEDVVGDAEGLRIIEHDQPGDGTLIDFGVDAEGGLEAGCALASICMSGLADITVEPGLLDYIGWSYVQVVTDSPVAACLFSQYAGWQISVGKFFAMGSGPMRAVYSANLTAEAIVVSVFSARSAADASPRRKPWVGWQGTAL